MDEKRLAEIEDMERHATARCPTRDKGCVFELCAALRNAWREHDEARKVAVETRRVLKIYHDLYGHPTGDYYRGPNCEGCAVFATQLSWEPKPAGAPEGEKP